MISYKTALKQILSEGSRRSAGREIVPVEDIAGRIAAKDIVAPIANQPFDNSAMDGYAVRAEELANAGESQPVELDVIGHIAAGDRPVKKAPAHGQCYEIMTGAPMPPGCDTVIPVEKTEKAESGKIRFFASMRKGSNVRLAGEDFAAGDILVHKGTVLHAGHVMVLATAGVGEVSVLRRLKIGIVSTGSEVVEDLKAPLAPGQIYNSSGPYLRAALRTLGVEFIFYGTVADEPEKYRALAEKAVADKCDVILSTGAVSAGVHDFVPSVLEAARAEILFHKVAIRPGKPVLFARFPSNGPFFFGLPGNPVSTAAGLRFFVVPLMRALQGLPPEEPQKAILKNPYSKGKAGLCFFLRAVLHHTGKTTHEVEIPAKQQSFMVSPFASANVWAVLPEGVESAKEGDIIDIFPL